MLHSQPPLARPGGRRAAHPYGGPSPFGKQGTGSRPCLPRGPPRGAPLGAGGAISRTAPGDFEPSGGRPPAAICRCHGGRVPAAAGERPAAGAGVRPGREVPAAGGHGEPGRAPKRQPGGGTVSGRPGGLQGGSVPSPPVGSVGRRVWLG